MVEDYVTRIWKSYEWPGGRASTTELAESLGVTASTVSANLKKLARDGYIHYEPYGAITLTEPGHRLAVRLVRRHRIIETYLVQQLGLTWDQVDDEADRLEHAISDLVLDRMDAALGHPTHDPHGDPIPSEHGELPDDPSRPLPTLEPGVAAVISRVSDRSPDVLRYLSQRGLTTGTPLHLVEVNTAASALAVSVEGEPIELSLTTAQAIRVVPQ